MSDYAANLAQLMVKAAGMMPPMDPAMMGGMPPMDPAAAGGMPPMDPAMAGGAPPLDAVAPPEGGGDQQVTPDTLSRVLEKAVEQPTPSDVKVEVKQVTPTENKDTGSQGQSPEEQASAALPPLPSAANVLAPIGPKLSAVIKDNYTRLKTLSKVNKAYEKVAKDQRRKKVLRVIGRLVKNATLEKKSSVDKKAFLGLDNAWLGLKGLFGGLSGADYQTLKDRGHWLGNIWAPKTLGNSLGNSYKGYQNGR